MDERHRQIYNRLKAKVDAQRVLIKANPFPYIDRLQRENARLHAAIDEAYVVLSGVHNFDYATDIAPGAEPSMVETSIKQNSEARDLLWRALQSES